MPERPAVPKLVLASEKQPLTEDDLPLAVVIAEAHPGQDSPILSKIYQESKLRLAANRVALHPSAAAEYGVADGGWAFLQTRCGKLEIVVTLDAGVPPGVVQVAGGARFSDLCGSSPRAKVVRV